MFDRWLHGYSSSTTHTSLSSSVSEPTKKKPVKSIFDLDYDEDDDPINFFKSNHNTNDNSNNYYGSYNVNNRVCMANIRPIGTIFFFRSTFPSFVTHLDAFALFICLE